MKMGEIRIDRIRHNDNSRDDVVKVLNGLHQLCINEVSRAQLFALSTVGCCAVLTATRAERV